jgi:hypothetical protein
METIALHMDEGLNHHHYRLTVIDSHLIDKILRTQIWKCDLGCMQTRILASEYE